MNRNYQGTWLFLVTCHSSLVTFENLGLLRTTPIPAARQYIPFTSGNIVGNAIDTFNDPVVGTLMAMVPLPLPSKITVGGRLLKLAAKIIRQGPRRGWTEKLVQEAVEHGAQFAAPNKINPANGATRFVHPTTGQSVVVDNVTNEIIHVGGPGFKY